MTPHLLDWLTHASQVEVYCDPSQADLEKYCPRAQAVARFCERWGMRYEEIIGRDDYVERLVEADVPLSRGQEIPPGLGDDFVVIPPGGVIQQIMFMRWE